MSVWSAYFIAYMKKYNILMAQEGIQKFEIFAHIWDFLLRHQLWPQRTNSLLEIWFSVFCNTFLSVWGAHFNAYMETFNIMIAPKWISEFTIFAHFPEFLLKLSGKHQLWPHRTPRTGWKFGFLFFGVSSGEFKVVICPLISTNYWLQGL